MTGKNKELAVLRGAHQGHTMYRKIPKMRNNNYTLQLNAEPSLPKRKDFWDHTALALIKKQGDRGGCDSQQSLFSMPLQVILASTRKGNQFCLKQRAPFCKVCSYNEFCYIYCCSKIEENNVLVQLYKQYQYNA